MNGIKKRLQQKKNQNQVKESEIPRNDFIELKKGMITEKSYTNKNELNLKISPTISQKNEEKYKKIICPTNYDICSKLLQLTMNNEKQLYLLPYAKKKEKIKKTFETIGNSNGISYSKYSVIKGVEMDNNNIINIIRNDKRKSLSKRSNFSKNTSLRTSNYS